MKKTIYNFILFVILMSACTYNGRNELPSVAEDLNTSSYSHRYRNIDSTRIYSNMAYNAAKRAGNKNDMAKAILGLVFFEITKMNYHAADSLLQIADSLADNDITHLNIAVQRMRLCQRRSSNKDFYFNKYDADRYIEKIHSSITSLKSEQRKEYTYAKSEYGIVLSTYQYYVNLKEESSKAIYDISEDADIALLSDTAQFLAYLYNIGSGGIIRQGKPDEILKKEFDCLMQCYFLAHHHNYLYWEANALQGLAEMLNSRENIERIEQIDPACLRYINDDNVADTMLSGNLAERSLQCFVRYGDIYQIAGSWRTLSQCYKTIEDHEAELACLENALSDSIIQQAPDLVASISEKMSMAYSALGEKQASDFYRNKYIDMQDSTRQDRQLEARAEALSEVVDRSHKLVAAIIIVFCILVAVVVALIYIRHHRSYVSVRTELTNRINNWQNKLECEIQIQEEKIEKLEETCSMLTIQSEDALRLSIEQHAKVQFAQNILPLIDRMARALYNLTEDNRAYVKELCEMILKYNSQLTSWIQLRRGQVSLHIQNFQLNELLDIVRMGNNAFLKKNISLNVENTDFIVKADKVLTLFVLNTLTDNARKFTPEGGNVEITVRKIDFTFPQALSYAEITVSNSGEGMTEEKALHLFDYKPIIDEKENLKEQKSHGFGLMNCRGIMDRYRKTSELFSHCEIKAESGVGKSTRVSFRLPMVLKMIVLPVVMLFSSIGYAAPNVNANIKAEAFADSVYNCNLNARYSDAIKFADSCLITINSIYRKIQDVDTNDTLTLPGTSAEMRWKKKNLPLNYGLITFIRNEVAVAALALNKWDLYSNNNEIYTSLYKICSQDTTLSTYCQQMEKTEQKNAVFVLILAMLFIVLIVVFWWFYLREVMLYKRTRHILERLIAELDKKEDIDIYAINTLKESKYIEISNIAKYVHERNDALNTQRLGNKTKLENLNDTITLKKRERDRSYVSNNVIDNTLSALKHETMYFPSRIASMVDISEDTEIRETVGYYRSLYSMFCSQCKLNSDDLSYKMERFRINQLKLNFCKVYDMQIIANRQLMDYAMLLLKRKNDKEMPEGSAEPNGQYVMLYVNCKNIQMTDDEVSKIFTLETSDTDYLILRQILRETATATNRFATGIRAEVNNESERNKYVRFIITLPLLQN